MSWRDTGRPAKIFHLEAWIIFVWVFALFPFGLKKLAVAAVITIAMTVLSAFRLNTISFLRVIRAFLAGDRRGSVARRKKRKAT